MFPPKGAGSFSLAVLEADLLQLWARGQPFCPRNFWILHGLSLVFGLICKQRGGDAREAQQKSHHLLLCEPGIVTALRQTGAALRVADVVEFIADKKLRDLYVPGCAGEPGKKEGMDIAQ